MTFSVRSVATPELFFGHEIQSMPAGASAFAARVSSTSRTARDFAKRKIKSRSLSDTGERSHFASASLSSDFTSAGICSKATRNPSLMPNFFGRGVPEYPGMKFALDLPAPLLLFWSVVSLARPNLKALFLGENFNGAVAAVRDKICRAIRHCILAAQFFLDRRKCV